jgi:hypothetical protein
MKEFRKNEQGNLICEDCGLICKTKSGLGHHVAKRHNTKDYFDKWIKDENDGQCKICKIETKFNSLSSGYKNGCCKQHHYDWDHIQVRKANMKKYGFEYIFQSKEFKEKSKQTKKEKYGNENYVNVEKGKQTCIERYGVENIRKSKKTKERIKQTCIERYGVENPT